jgi:aspartate-semialdehyde dehydrogenase
MDKSYRIALVGATGLVGREMIKGLEERGFPIEELLLLASERSAGENIEFRGKRHRVHAIAMEHFAHIDIAIMSAGSSVSEEWAPIATSQGAVVIDNSSKWRMDPDIPLVVPEVNPEDIGQYTTKGIIANPNCSTIQMVVALAPLHKKAQLKRVVVSTYQAVSGAGRQGMQELSTQVADLFNQRDAVCDVFSARIAFNCIPQIDVFMESGFTKEEEKMIYETRKIMHLPELGVCPTCVRVPIFNGHSESISAEFEHPLDVDDAQEAFKKAPGILVIDDRASNSFPTALSAEGNDSTYLGRIRQDPSVPHGLSFWCVADNLRKGAATNAIQIAELLIREHLK